MFTATGASTVGIMVGQPFVFDKVYMLNVSFSVTCATLAGGKLLQRSLARGSSHSRSQNGKKDSGMDEVLMGTL